MLHTLPYDLIRIITYSLDGSDIAHLLSACRSLHTLIDDEGIWLEQCSRYKLTDRAVFDNATYREIYTLVLHTYGPLLGLWASDHPYRGSIIEFRYDAGYKGIVGEVWRFWIRQSVFDSINSLHMPKLPEYFAFFSVALPARHAPRQAVLNWHIHHNGVEYFGPADDFFTVPTMHVLSETDQSQFIHYHAGTCRLPDFPDPAHTAWYDATRGVPRLPVESSPASAALRSDPIPSAAFLYIGPGPTPKPRALAFAAAPPGVPELFALHEPRLQVQDLRGFDLGGREARRGPPVPRRFYPLRCAVLPGDEPGDERWDARSLAGVWLGAYASHGTEVLYVDVDERGEAVRALKLTGDLNVPRGVVTWQFALRDRMRLEDLPHDLQRAQVVFGDLNTVRIYRGTGTISGTGFVEEHRGESTDYIGIVSRDEIRVNWFDMDEDYAPRYRRYRGRDLDTEEVNGNLRTPAPWS
ncbi:F-box only protein 31 [Phanerochaete sordida]|uniref:F-box only protein 31 n=1 Tax=Phanerochaete sordida TaxID=48140 RepID=A0A9P3GP34_9APHY|nr:F-box only protein 31 [Phanerochaete sordida]